MCPQQCVLVCQYLKSRETSREEEAAEIQAMIDFHNNKEFYRKCMWLQLRQVLKIFTEGNARKFTVSFVFVLMLSS